ncbi:MAG: alpha/beta fold hydrolase [Gammaproteobacteria bacterium]|nr:alpha/beta fold hydrolase [Gammaproteobacteria bacterium]MCH9743571.1 alpha/beta fold hydrolase [Gammaproteobacteria bacterium]
MSQPEVLLLHGWGFNRTIWTSLQKLLFNYVTTAIDLPGFGEAHYISGSYKPNNITDIITKRIRTPTIIIGWSLGGLIALLASLLAPEMIHKIIIINSNPCFVRQQKWPGVSSTFIKNFIEHFNNKPQKLLQHFLRQIAYNKNEHRILNHKLVLPKSHQHTAWGAALRLLQQTNLSSHLDSLKIPCQFLLSENDLLIPHCISKHIKAKNPSIGCKIIKNSGHFSLLHNPKEIVNAIKKTKNYAVI